MEYLSRSLKSIVGTFGFHPRCKSINLIHLCFADDLMIFCKGGLSFVRVICECIKIQPLKEDIKDISQFALGTLPFRYPSVPLSSKCLSITECEQLADKMTKRISSWQCKHLSYAARLQLINSVLLVGGLGIRNIHLWNQTAVGKIAWHIHMMRETLWVKWVHGVYTKALLRPWVCKDEYSIKEVYESNLGNSPKVQWRHLVWNRLSIPKTRFICWLATHQGLKTKDKLRHIGVVDDDMCSLCGIKDWTCIVLKPFPRMDFRKPRFPHMHMKSGTGKPFIEGGPRFHTDANKVCTVFLTILVK
ncbi:uncharacterized protein LOC130813571 [Amaranthus tricolor]|uniref:uncharacterized protein LOC130813571 n=1 Tax=Amaranthus tricolor TaxID=29722 RepID=UPI00258555D0|nr:uncharacterized protein LOC130813571 [Amaranthus tricolor]